MKTHIQFTKTDGDHGVALTHGAITTLEQAKQELANTLSLPEIDGVNRQESLDARLRNGDIDPDSITFDPLSE